MDSILRSKQTHILLSLAITFRCVADTSLFLPHRVDEGPQDGTATGTAQLQAQVNATKLGLVVEGLEINERKILSNLIVYHSHN
jgi:hypothetical protein